MKLCDITCVELTLFVWGPCRADALAIATGLTQAECADVLSELYRRGRASESRGGVWRLEAPAKALRGAA